MAGDPDSQQLDTTLTALEGGVADLNPNTALGVLDSWQERLTREADPRLREIALDLATLKTALTAPEPDPTTLAMTLQGLGDKTLAAAEQGGPYRPQLLRLGNALTAATRKLRGE